MPQVAYGNDKLYFEPMPDDLFIEAEPQDGGPEWDKQVFGQRLEAAGFDKIVSLGKVLIVVNDAFRPTPTGQVLSQLKSLYPALKADFMVARGNHPAPDAEDIKKIFAGYKRDDSSKLFSHDSRDYESMTEVGKSNGHPFFLNKKLFEYPAVITIGSVEPHYFAGFTGGRKSLVPGCADIETNRRNHAMAVEPTAQPLKIKGNPVAEDLDELLKIVGIKNLFSIQIVNGRNQKILDGFAGSITKAFEQAVAVANKVYAYKTDKPFDLVIAEMRSPLDRNLYQLQKAVENCASAVADGGTILAVSECPEGIGNDEFYQLAGKLGTEGKVLECLKTKNPPLGIHKLSRIIDLSKRIGVKALTSLEENILEHVFWQAADSIETEMNALRSKKDSLRILLVRDAGLLVAKLDF
ncbi:MAG: DUF2088 domain-containing protein [candidate division Zixibacteria bacterium]|nr:DUF2088 domain-containing protein [candidate division Zixibacteria bacterium]